MKDFIEINLIRRVVKQHEIKDEQMRNLVCDKKFTTVLLGCVFDLERIYRIVC